MKKIVSIILVAMMLLTPVMSMAATLNIGTKLSGFALQETVSLDGEYTVTIPKNMYMVENAAQDGMEMLVYITETAEKQFLIAATPLEAEADSMSRTIGKNHKALLNSSSATKQVELPEELAEVVGDNAVLFRTVDGEFVIYQMVLFGEGGYRFNLISLTSLEEEAEALGMVCALRKN